VDGSKGSLVSKAFGDALSYPRLFALGLASIKLAEANGLAATAFESGGVGLLLACWSCSSAMASTSPWDS
jgi:vacuolar-type H+-ATPase subunit I/STV1